LQVFNCERLGDLHYLVAVPAIDCDSRGYKELRRVASAMVAFYVVGLPVALLAFLFYRYRKDTQFEETEQVPDEQKIPENDQEIGDEQKKRRGLEFKTNAFRAKYGVLTECYTPKRCGLRSDNFFED